jgi:hypothetical protein
MRHPPHTPAGLDPTAKVIRYPLALFGGQRTHLPPHLGVASRPAPGKPLGPTIPLLLLHRRRACRNEREPD